MGAIGSLFVKIASQFDDAGFAKAQTSMAKFRSGITALAKSTAVMGVAFAAFSAKAIKEAADFQMQLANVSTMLDDTSIMQEYKKELLTMSVQFGESTETLTKGLYDISWEFLSALIEINPKLTYNKILIGAISHNVNKEGLEKLERDLSIEDVKNKPMPTLVDLERMMAARGGRVNIIKNKKGNK